MSGRLRIDDFRRIAYVKWSLTISINASKRGSYGLPLAMAEIVVK